MFQWLKDIIPDRTVKDVRPADDLTLGVPIRMLDNNTGDQPEDELVYGISQEELLKFLRDNHFSQNPAP